MSAENLFTGICFVVGVIFLIWINCNGEKGKKKDGHKKEYRTQDPIPFDEIP